MDVQTFNYYERHATELVGRYAAAGEGISRHFRRAFAGCRQVLDVGCGSGRDVRRLRQLGIAAEGVDASPAMIAAATAADPALGKALRTDRLPELASCLDGAYDGVLCAAVLQHLPDDCRFDAAFGFRRILKPGGKLLISFPLADSTISQETFRDSGSRLYSPLPPARLQLLLERTGFALLWHEDNPDSLGREHRTWATMLFQRQDGYADRPLHTVESILNRDSKDATYKLALIRALAEIAQTQHGQAIWCPDGRVKVPTAVIAGRWLEYYWPLVASPVFIPQKHGERPNCVRPIAFRGQMSLLVAATRQAGLGGLPGFTVAARSGKLPPLVSAALQAAMRKLKETVWNMPVRYAGAGEFSVFQYDRNDQTVVMDGSLWREFSLTGSWIVDATILRWGELTSRIAKGDLPPSRVIDLLLLTALPERDTDAVRTALAGVSSLHCVWTNQALKNYDIDHAIPYSLDPVQKGVCGFRKHESSRQP